MDIFVNSKTVKGRGTINITCKIFLFSDLENKDSEKRRKDWEEQICSWEDQVMLIASGS
jgi:hypothetical protein